MLSFKSIGAKANSAGGFSKLMDGDTVVCYHESWLLHSCGVSSFESMNANIPWWTKKNLDRLCEFLKTAKDAYSSYVPTEYYIGLSSSQVKMFEETALLSDPRVKLVDKFKNKAHDPNDICLYRLSINGDFSPREKSNVSS